MMNETEPKIVPSGSQVMDCAWRDYRHGLEEIRAMLYRHPYAAVPYERDKAHYLFHQIQAAAFNMVIAPRPDYPRFYMHTLSDPKTYTWVAPNPDFAYSVSFLDGRRSYCIHGRRSNSHMVLIQAVNYFLSLPLDRMRLLGNFDLDKMTITEDGSFEIIASAKKHPGNWIPLDPESPRNVLIVREAFVDWDMETRTIMNVEPTDDVPPHPIVYSEAEMAERLDEAVRFMKYCLSELSINAIPDAVEEAGGWNAFAVPQLQVTHNTSANPMATYNLLAFEIGEADAIIIEIEPPNPKYWGMHLIDCWNQCLDYTYHQSSLNGPQSAVDADGRIRAVISLRDPGIRNWLDPVGNRKGGLYVRWYDAKSSAIPKARKVPVTSVLKELPAGATRVTPEQRAKSLARRRDAIRRRYDF